MRIHQLLSGFCRSLRDFRCARAGNVAVTFALVSIPVIGGAAAAIDYSHANAIKAAMQSALDSTALTLARNASTMTPGQMQTEGTKHFKALFKRSDAKSRKITVVASSGSTVQVNGSAVMDTSLMTILGLKTINITGSSTAALATQARLRVALVLDNTGSMAQSGKMPALQTAAKNMVAKLASAATANGDVYVSIVPFVKDVNLGAGNYDASWIDWTAWDETNGRCSNWYYSSKTSCLSKSGNTWTPTSHSTWNGCVVDRGDAGGPNAGDYDANAVAPSSTVPATLYVPEQYGSCPQAAMGLSYNWSAMTSLINRMSPAGNTNQAIGLQVGWMTLMTGGVFDAPAKDPNFTYAEHIVLLTDGLNTEDRWYTDQASIDARQQILCDTVKAAGITLWTIQVNTGGDPTSTLLRNCASDPSKFFLLTSANEIISTFENISFKITQLHLSK